MSKVMKLFICKCCLNLLVSTGCTSVDIGAQCKSGVSGNQVELQQAEIRMVRWICDIKVKIRIPCKRVEKD